MSPVPLSPVKMSPPLRTASSESADAIRKRVCKACDRCRLKKSKCDGSNPCLRCKADNAICVFGERKKSHDKVYPKGYVEMLEQQQGQLVSGMQELYRRLLQVQAWPGTKLEEANGYPLTHDILAALDLLESKHDGSGEVETFEEDCSKLQSKILADGAGFVRRRGSSDSEHSQHGDHPRSLLQGTRQMPQNRPSFRDSFNFGSASAAQASQSPAHRSQRSFPPAPAQPSPLQQSSAFTGNDPQFYQSEWTIPDMSTPEMLMRSKFATQTPTLQDNMSSQMQAMYNNYGYDSPMAWDHDNGNGSSYNQQFTSSYPNMGMQDFDGPDYSGDAEFNNFVSVQT